jgi:hypothetical protein
MPDLTDVPDLATVREYLHVPATILSDEDLERMRIAALTDQLARCAWPGMDDEVAPAPYPDALSQGLLRRIQREAAAKNLPLGMVGLDGGEYGPQRLPAWDALITEHEHAFRIQVVG